MWLSTDKVKLIKAEVLMEQMLRILEDQELQPVLTEEDLEVVREVRAYLGEV